MRRQDAACRQRVGRQARAPCLTEVRTFLDGELLGLEAQWAACTRGLSSRRQLKQQLLDGQAYATRTLRDARELLLYIGANITSRSGSLGPGQDHAMPTRLPRHVAMELPR